MKFNSIKFEISILYTAILGLILIAFSGVLYFISNTFLNQVDQQLKVKAQAVDLNIRSYLNVLGETHPALTEAIGRTLAMKNPTLLQYKTWKINQQWNKQTQAFNLNRDYINFVGKNGQEIYSSANVDKNMSGLFLEDPQFPSRGQSVFWTAKLGNKNFRVVNYPFSYTLLGRYLIQVGIPQDALMQQLRNWLYSIAISVPLVLLLTNFVGRLLANRILRPVHEITNLAKQITQQDLSARITGKHFDEEMGSLIESFNDMIARLEESFKHIEQFSYHVAHELKTPLTIIQGEANLLLRRERTVPEYKQALRIVLEESQRVLKTIDDLLLLTKLGYQNEVFKFEPFDFMEFFSEVVEQNRLTVANKGIGIRMNYENLKSPLMVNGDRLHLRRLFFNLIDNAVRFTPENMSIDMRIEKNNYNVITSISDSGPGIDPENLAKIFHQVDKNASGSGLGLNIAYTIAKFHKGDIQVESTLGSGTTFKVILPLQN